MFKSSKNYFKILFLVFFVQFFCIFSVTAFAEIKSSVKEVQKYGNLIIDKKSEDFYADGFEYGDIINVKVKDVSLEIPFCTSYTDVDVKDLVIRDDKDSKNIIVAINMGNFSKTYDVNVGDSVTFSISKKAGYLSEYLLRQLTRTNDRNDYATDSIYANFRNVTTTGVGKNILYRSSSPINNEINRASFASELADSVSINTVVNLADTYDSIEKHAKKEDFNSKYYYKLFKKGQVKPVNMGVDVTSSDFSAKLKEALRFIINNEGPYLVHCNEGKDRAGFVSAILEAFMGASYEEIIKDYMITYENYYGVEKDSEQYNAIAKSNIVNAFTTVICKLEKGTDISKLNLSDYTRKYLLGIGMTDNELELLKNKLSKNYVFNNLKVSGKVLEIEKYGHASTNILIKDMNKLGFKYGDLVTIIFDNGFVLDAPYLDGYYVDVKQPLVRAYNGHTNIAICINYEKLSDVAKIKEGDTFTILLKKKSGYLTEYEVRKLERTNNREDYSSDEVFANFRNINFGKIGKNNLYRSASAIDNQIGRAAYVNKLAEKVGINTIVNFSDSKEKIKEHISKDDFNSLYYKQLFEKGRVEALNVGIAYRTDDFKAGINKAVKHMAKYEGPYLFHCVEGKDRAGFYAILLEALMGASKDEIIDDYMVSYKNYYGVEKGTEKYNIISKDGIEMLKYISGSDNLDINSLRDGAKRYILSTGVTEKELAKLISNLEKNVKIKTDVSKVDKKIETSVREDSKLKTKETIEYYIVKKGDTLWKISENKLGDGKFYKDIYNLNKDKIKDFNTIKIGQKIVIKKVS